MTEQNTPENQSTEQNTPAYVTKEDLEAMTARMLGEVSKQITGLGGRLKKEAQSQIETVIKQQLGSIAPSTESTDTEQPIAPSTQTEGNTVADAIAKMQAQFVEQQKQMAQTVQSLQQQLQEKERQTKLMQLQGVIEKQIAPKIDSSIQPSDLLAVMQARNLAKIDGDKILFNVDGTFKPVSEDGVIQAGDEWNPRAIALTEYLDPLLKSQFQAFAPKRPGTGTGAEPGQGSRGTSQTNPLKNMEVSDIAQTIKTKGLDAVLGMLNQ